MGVTRRIIWGGLRLNHYVTKSRTEFHKRKIIGQAADGAEATARRRSERYFEDHDKNDELDVLDDAYIKDVSALIKSVEARVGRRSLNPRP